MNSSALGAILGALALVGVGVVYFRVDQLSDEIRPLTRVRAEVDRGALARGGEEYRQEYAPDEEEPVSHGQPGAAKAHGKATGGKPGLEARLARLEAAEQVREAKREQTRARYASFGKRRVHTMDGLSKRLKLTPTQSDRIKDAIDRGKQRIKDILKIPDEEGKSPLERRAEQRKKMKEAVASGDHGNVLRLFRGGNYQGKQIPGRNATYGQEIARIKKETRDEISQTLSSEQKKTFDDTNIDAMTGEAGGMVFSHTIAIGDGGEEGGIAGGIAVADVAFEVPEPLKIEAEKKKGDGE